MAEVVVAKLDSEGVKVVRTIDPAKVRARCEAAREQRKAMPLTHKPFAQALRGMKAPKKGK